MNNFMFTAPERANALCEAVFRERRIALERLRVYHLVEFKERQRLKKMAAAKRALSISNKLKNPASKKYHRSRIFSALNKLRAAA